MSFARWHALCDQSENYLDLIDMNREMLCQMFERASATVLEQQEINRDTMRQMFERASAVVEPFSSQGINAALDRASDAVSELKTLSYDFVRCSTERAHGNEEDATRVDDLPRPCPIRLPHETELPHRTNDDEYVLVSRVPSPIASRFIGKK